MKEFITDPATVFDFLPAEFVPFRDREVCERVRKMSGKERIEVHALATCGTFSSWQRMTSRLVTHGPVTPLVPSSMLQTRKTQVYISEELAAPFACREKVGY